VLGPQEALRTSGQWWASYAHCSPVYREPTGSGKVLEPHRDRFHNCTLFFLLFFFLHAHFLTRNQTVYIPSVHYSKINYTFTYFLLCPAYLIAATRKVYFVCLVFLWGLNSWLCAYKTGARLLEPHLRYILLWLFWRWGLMNCLPGLTSNRDPPDLSLPSS
jgi:hypothetical protein